MATGIRITTLHMLPNVNLLALLVIVTLCFTGCENVPAQSVDTLMPSLTSLPGNISVNVEMDIFSGKPNPQWTLSQEDAVRFLKMVEGLPTAPDQILDNPLDYRGMLIRVGDNEEISYRIWRGVVVREENLTFFHDENRDIERWLLFTGKSYMEDELFQIVLYEID
jgi:hypothetical protein